MSNRVFYGKTLKSFFNATETDEPPCDQRGRGTTAEDPRSEVSPQQRFKVQDETRKHFRNFAVTGIQLKIRIVSPPVTVDPVSWLEQAVEEIFNYAIGMTTNTSDYVGFSINAPSFAMGAAGMSFRPVRDCHHEDLWSLIFGVTQSASEFVIDDTLDIRASIVHVPEGRGRTSKRLTHRDVRKRSIVEVNEDNLCLPRALVVARAHAYRGSLSDNGSEPSWDQVRRANSKTQRLLAEKLCRDAGVSVQSLDRGCGIREIRLFQRYLIDRGLAVVVYDFKTFARGGQPIYDGESVIRGQGCRVTARLNIMYYANPGHYKPILNLTAAAATRQYCASCNVGYRHINDHRCTNRCPSCVKVPACDTSLQRLRCETCGRWFYGEECLRRHRQPASFNARKSVCETLYVCVGCCRFVNRAKRTHVCGSSYCRQCASVQNVNHMCHMKPLGKVDTGDDTYLFVWYDFETRQTDTLSDNPDINVHVPNLCVVHQACTRCIDVPEIRVPCSSCGLVREFVFREDPVKQLFEFATRDVQNFKKIICIAHNAGGFDSQFVLRYAVEKYRDPPNVILNGTKIVLMEINKTRFLDSMAYMPMSLAALPKAFGLPESSRKGVFPHLFNTRENEGYVGPMPPAEFYSPDSMGTAERRAFTAWYDEAVSTGAVFDFDTELVEYCKSDVDILRRACVAFRQIFLNCGGLCPFAKSTTIASACSLVYRTNFLKPLTIGILPSGGYRFRNKQSAVAIRWLVWKERELGIVLSQAARGREHVIPETGRPVDGYHVSDDGTRTVFEFHGCYWHGCRRCYNVNRDHRLSDGSTLDDRYDETAAKTARMRDVGYNVVETWECDFKQLVNANPAIDRFVNEHPLVKFATSDVLNPRDAFYGGRTGNTKRYYRALANEEIRYVDVCSLYPWVCKYGTYPVRHPKIYVGEECRALTGPDNTDVTRVEGLIKCTVLPPRHLYHPVLPVRMRGKLMFPLCRSCCALATQTDCPHDDTEDRLVTGTWVSLEVRKAVEMGYVVTEVIEIWQYEVVKYNPVTKQGGLFASYIDTFLKIKQEASGWPDDCTDDASKSRYLEQYEKVEGVRLDREKIVKNAGLRSVSKLCLNSFWGKFGQRDNLPRTEVVRERQRLLELLTDPETEVTDVLPVNDEVLYVRTTRTNESVTPSPLTNVVLAAYTTAQARLKLYSYLEALDRRVLYYDTDSVIYVRRGAISGEYEPPIGNFLGEMTDELSQYGHGSSIREFVSGGPKFYAFRVRTPGGKDVEVCKVRGITLNYQTSRRINFDGIRDMVTNGSPAVHVDRRAILRTALHHVITRGVTKKCEPVQTKRRVCNDGYDTLPFGYKS